MNRVKLIEKFIETSDEIGIYEFVKKNGIHYADEMLLELAIENNNLEMAKLLVKLGADVNGQDTFFAYAIKSGNYDLIQFLVEKGVDVDPDESLSIAVLYNVPFDIIFWLIDYGADPTYENGDIFVSAASYARIDIIKLFLANAELNDFDLNSAMEETILSASRAKLSLAVQALPEEFTTQGSASQALPGEFLTSLPKGEFTTQGSDPKTIDPNQPTQKQYLEMAKYLLELGASVNYSSGLPLRQAVLYGCYDIAKLLLEAGVGEKDRPLVIAAEKGHEELVKLLLKYGANPVYNNGIVIERAMANGYDKIVKILLTNADRKDAFDKPSEPNNKEIVNLPKKEEFASSLSKGDIVEPVIN